MKTSRRDLALGVARKTVGSTTVSATMIAAHMAGIKVFVTGGIGGVHRGDFFDVSADLTELGKTPIAVICAGVKSILDIEKTLEYLETQGVTNVTFGSSDEFPAFYTRTSGFKSMAALPTAKECAELIHVNQELGLQSGIVIACPIPETDQVNGADQFEKVIEAALEEATTLGIKGKETTPFLLGKIKDLTKGDSLRANIALVMNNARIGAQIAKQYSLLSLSKRLYSTKRPLVIGGSVLDISARTDSATMKEALYTSSPGTISKSPGGVGRNVVQVCQMVGGNPMFLSSIGNDVHGEFLINHLVRELGFNPSDLYVDRLENHQTATYNSFFDSLGELIGAVADMKIQAETLYITKIPLERISIVAVDGNVSRDTLVSLFKVCISKRIPILFEPTSVSKSMKLIDLIDAHQDISCFSFITPDYHELQTIAQILKNRKVNSHIPRPRFTGKQLGDGELDDIKDQIETMLICFPNVVIKLGKRGCLVGTRRSGSRRCNIDGKVSEPVYKITWVQGNRPLQIVNVNGAGDSLVGVLVAGLSHIDNDIAVLPHEKLVELVRKGVLAAELTCESVGISRDITQNILQSECNTI